MKYFIAHLQECLENFKDIYIEADERLINLFINSFENNTQKILKFGFFSENKKNLKK